MKRNVKYVEAKEIVKPGKHQYTYVGIELERDKETVSVLGVGGSHWDDIDIYELETARYKFKVTDKERVHHLFDVATKEQRTEVTEAEIALMKARRNHTFCQNKLKEYFGGSTKILLNEDRED